jgi:hypothetical protein
MDAKARSRAGRLSPLVPCEHPKRTAETTACVRKQRSGLVGWRTPAHAQRDNPPDQFIASREDGDRVTGAIFGLIGVVVGGLLTAAVQAFQEWRSQRTLSRAAARLLSAELSVQQSILEDRGSDEPAEPVSDEMPAVSDWPQSRAVMARVLDDEAWIAVAGAYAKLLLWHWESPASRETSEEKRRELLTLATEVEAARATLQGFRFGSDRPSSAAAGG